MQRKRAALFFRLFDGGGARRDYSELLAPTQRKGTRRVAAAVRRGSANFLSFSLPALLAAGRGRSPALSPSKSRRCRAPSASDDFIYRRRCPTADFLMTAINWRRRRGALASPPSIALLFSCTAAFPSHRGQCFRVDPRFASAFCPPASARRARLMVRALGSQRHCSPRCATHFFRDPRARCLHLYQFAMTDKWNCAFFLYGAVVRVASRVALSGFSA